MRVTYLRIEWLLVPDAWFRGRIARGMNSTLGPLPLQHPHIAVRELERAVVELGLKGVSVSTNVDGRELADPLFDPVWAAAADLGAVVFIHPWGCSLGR